MINSDTHQVDFVVPPQLRDIPVLLEHPLQIDKDDRRKYSLQTEMKSNFIHAK